MVAAEKKRPKYLNLTKIKQPIPAIVSILHRISGAGLFLFIPFGLAGLQASLGSDENAARWSGIFNYPLTKLVLFGLIWAYLYHFCAGLRYLLLDLHLGIDLQSARATSYGVIAASLLLTLPIAVKLW